ncbi:MAG: cytochrome c [Nitrospirae bacterium]|nr:MAG: cytochrome c [Nitrospirota bacterium]
MALRRVFLASAGLLVFLSSATSGSSQEFRRWLASHLENGQRIYMSGVTAQGRVVQNSHGMEGVGCAMCHGPDGRGGTMHGIPVPNITVPLLTDPRGNEHNGRTRPAYNEETIKAAIVAGIDSGGNALHPEMPRWTGLTARDLDDLIGFLKTLGAVRRGSPEMSQGL